MCRAKFLLAAAIALILVPGCAVAGVSWFDRDTLQGVFNVGIAASDGISSWSAGGFGKSRFGRGLSGEGGLELVWRPQITDDVSLVVDGIAQPRFGQAVDIAEAYALYKPVPASPLRFQARAGMLYIPISLEHDSAAGEPWSVRDTITPSAINTWAGEELKALGGEARVERAFEPVTVATTIGVFSRNDTSGTLLALRGWAFSDLVATAFARVPLPRLSDYVSPSQATHTVPVDSVDGRLGVYSKLQVAHSRGSIDLTYYDNNAQLGAGHDGQWAWRTDFLEVGAAVPLGNGMMLTSQFIDGRTRAQLGSPVGYRFDVRFRAAYLRLVKQVKSDTFTARADVFSTLSPHPSAGELFYHPGVLDPDETYSENGWSGLTAWKHDLSPGHSLIGELLYIDWRRRYLSAFAELPHQASTTFQLVYRQAF